MYPYVLKHITCEVRCVPTVSDTQEVLKVNQKHLFMYSLKSLNHIVLKTPLKKFRALYIIRLFMDMTVEAKCTRQVNGKWVHKKRAIPGCKSNSDIY